MSIADKHIVLGVTGSIAAYKSAELVRRLRDAGAEVRVVMTEGGRQFITPLTMQAVSGYPVRQDLFDCEAEAAMGHIELARWADLVLIAPASANFMSRLAEGRADDLLSTLCLATTAPIFLAPAMNQQMWQNQRTQDNQQRLQYQGIRFLGPDLGHQACGETGFGRMLEPVAQLEALAEYYGDKPLDGVKLMLTAGPTREAIDPVRYLSNASSGRMGYALAAAAQQAGADVTLVSGPAVLPPPQNMQVISVTTAEEMYQAVMADIAAQDIFIGVAAVADYRVKQMSSQKQAKIKEGVALELVPNVDIVASVAQLENRPFVVGFAAETHDVLQKARSKRERKSLDLIIANEVGVQQGMCMQYNKVSVLGREVERHFPLTEKTQLARTLIELIAKQYRTSHDRESNAA